MPRIEHGNRWWYYHLNAELFDNNKFTDGVVQLSYGSHELFFSLPTDVNFTSRRVYLCCEGIGHPVCQGHMDMCNGVISHDGFIIYADIQHNVSNVYWIMEYTRKK
jgi:hypothetical protein